jgi:tetratricopeptide (TPR) repeat protein
VSESREVFAALEGKIDDADIEAYAEYIEENLAEYKETKDIASVVGLKSFGMTDEGVKATVSLGAHLVRQGHFLRAAEYFGALMQVEPFNADVAFWMGYIAHRLKNYDQATGFYRLAIANGAKDGVAKLYLGECLLHLGETNLGLAELAEGLVLARSNAKLRAQVLRGEKLVAAQTETK